MKHADIIRMQLNIMCSGSYTQQLEQSLHLTDWDGYGGISQKYCWNQYRIQQLKLTLHIIAI